MTTIRRCLGFLLFHFLIFELSNCYHLKADSIKVTVYVISMRRKIFLPTKLQKIVNTFLTVKFASYQAQRLEGGPQMIGAGFKEEWEYETT